MDLYELLGLARGATLIEIKRSYRRLARKYHPDINPGDTAAEARFRDITRAYETLSDPQRRVQYDEAGSIGESSVRVTYGFEGFDFSDAGHVASTFGDLFADIFTSRHQSRGGDPQQRGADVHSTVALTFDEAMQGAQRELTVARTDLCRVCHGHAQLRVAEARCPRCQGSGVLRSRRGSMVFAKPCEACAGSGRTVHMPCAHCGGTGKEARTESLVVRIPAGVADGARIRVPEKGNVGGPGGPPGDLYIAVEVAAHPLFERDGDDLHLVVGLAIHEAALGAKIDVPAPDGTARLRVPPGTQSGQRFRVRGHGAPSPRTGERGDLVVEVKLMLPKVLDERSKELLREFGRINSDSVRT